MSKLCSFTLKRQATGCVRVRVRVTLTSHVLQQVSRGRGRGGGLPRRPPAWNALNFELIFKFKASRRDLDLAQSGSQQGTERGVGPSHLHAQRCTVPCECVCVSCTTCMHIFLITLKRAAAHWAQTQLDSPCLRSPSLKWRSLGLTNGALSRRMPQNHPSHTHTHTYQLGHVCKNYWHTNPISWADIFCFWQSAAPKGFAVPTNRALLERSCSPLLLCLPLRLSPFILFKCHKPKNGPTADRKCVVPAKNAIIKKIELRQTK